MNIYVGNLSYRTTEAELKEAFAQFGEVRRAKIVKDRETDRSKGFGFVEYEDEALNEKAIDELNGKELDGRAIAVSVARPKEERPRDGGFRNNAGNGNAFRQRSW